MKPRIFVSSTFYDLKYVREDLSNFIKVHDFDPILFEDGDIGYIPGKSLDQSCYEQMRMADMVILIIGGNYGSAATGEIEDGFAEYMSVTRKEFQEAVREGIPIFAFIDASVFAEYGIYEENYSKIENGEMAINFRTTKNINVFRFVKEIKGIGHISITEFRKMTDIKEFLSKQWGDMFKCYLTSLRENSENAKLVGTVDELRTLMKKMDIMLDNVGRKVLNDGEDSQYDDVLHKQKIVELVDLIVKGIDFDFSVWGRTGEERYKLMKETIDVLIESVEKEWWDCLDVGKEAEIWRFFDEFKERGILLRSVLDGFNKEFSLWLPFLKDENNRQMVAHALSEDKNYDKMFENSFD